MATKVLIVDDDADIRRGLNVRLRANGYEVLFAADAISALTVAVKERPDLVILDKGLPAGDGYVVMERLQTSRPGVHPGYRAQRSGCRGE
jgi:two-component system KDP operon response regulator KdpE